MNLTVGGFAAIEVGWIERSISAFTMSVCSEYIDLGSVNSRLDAMLPAVEKKMRTALIGRLWHLRTLLKVLNLRKGERHAAADTKDETMLI